jgi:putative membrane-bound dehydrogenase-like protein
MLSAVLLCFGLKAEDGRERTGGNRLTYLSENDPFYVGGTFPRLTTPQWVGEEGVEAVVILAIDDMTEPARWERFLRPILDRLKQIDGRAPVSIMTVKVNPQETQLQSWLKEGLSLEVHTLTHPCPCLAQGNFEGAANTYHGCVELMNAIPGNKPVAFRMPCCDSMNSPSPRFYAEIFNRTNAAGQFLEIDSSVMNLTTPNDPAVPRELTTDADGKEKFRKYVPFPGFATTIENYPYPYVIGKLCWEFPGTIPSDWEAQHLRGTNQPATVADWKSALDVTVIKQGTMNLIFHPHGWIRNDQIVELIDYATQKYGKKVKFLTFREAQERLDRNLLQGHPLRAARGEDNGVRLVDLNNDGYLDVILANEAERQTRLWNPQVRKWTSSGFPTPIVARNGAGIGIATGVEFGIIHANGAVSALIHNEQDRKAWTFEGTDWVPDDALCSGLELDGKPVLTAAGAPLKAWRDRGVRFRDINGDGQCELVVGNESQNAVFSWSEKEKGWKRLPYGLPAHTSIVDEAGRDNGLRFADVNDDGSADVLFSNESWFSLHLFIGNPYLGFQSGWSREVLSGKRGESGEIPLITRSGGNNGAWFHERELWVQNELTAGLPDKVERRSFGRLLAGLQPPVLSPQDSLKAIRVHTGFKVELVAQEPLVQDPIAFDWGADGKLWVVEMGDYPLGVDNKGKPGGTIRFLEDTNQDGVYDRSTLFLDGLNFPTGVMPWGKGILVSAAPEIFYAEDTDGDGKADLRKPLFVGFKEGNQQHRLNGFEYGLDNWVYGANGDSGGRIALSDGKRRPPESPVDSVPGTVDISGRDFRFRTEPQLFEAQAGGTQFGRHRDDWGNWFGNNNSTWLWHYFLPEQYVRRNPNLAVRTNRRTLANYSNTGHLFPICRPLQRFNDIGRVGEVTSACSATPYRDDLFGSEFENSVFICEPVNNLIHREVLEADGISFTSHRSRDELDSEFLASTDNWFRPTMVKTGPDGALYIADMYRLVIEHPQWIPEDVKAQLDLRAGDDKGRIYRVYPAGSALRKIPRLAQLDTAGLVAALESPNGWQRDTAQRLLIERGDKKAIQLLRKVVASGERPKTRLQALCTLDGLDAATPEMLKIALRDSHAAVREHAVRISEQYLGNRSKDKSRRRGNDLSRGENIELGQALRRLVDDPAIRVRYQLAFTLGEWNDSSAAAALVKLASRDVDSEEMLLAVMSSAPGHLGDMLTAALSDPGGQQSALLEKLFELATAEKDEASLGHALAAIGKPAAPDKYAAWQFEALGGVLDALDNRGQSLTALQRSAGPELSRSVQQLDGLFRQAREMADSPATEAGSQSELLSELRVLGHGSARSQGDLERLGKFLQPQYPVSLQQAALRNLRRARDRKAGALLIASWTACSPALRPALLNSLLGRREWVEDLLTAIERDQIAARQIAAPEQQRLTTDRDPAVRKRAAKLFDEANPDRQQAIEAYRDVLTLTGDRTRGAVLFEQNCAVCHKSQGIGPVGPDLGTVADKPVDSLLVAILDPNRALETRYVNYTALLKDGRELSGLIAAETSSSITLRSATGEETILRRDLELLTSSGLSAMPEGFERVLTAQQMADLIAFVRKR